MATPLEPPPLLPPPPIYMIGGAGPIVLKINVVEETAPGLGVPAPPVVVPAAVPVPVAPAEPLAAPGFFQSVVAAAFAGPIARRFVPQFVENDEEFYKPWTEARDLPHFPAPPAPPPELRSTLGFTLAAEAVPANSEEGRTIARANADARMRHAAALAGDAVVITEYEAWGAELITGSVQVSEQQTVTATTATLVVDAPTPAVVLPAAVPVVMPPAPAPAPRRVPAPFPLASPLPPAGPPQRVPTALNASVRGSAIATVAVALASVSVVTASAASRSRPSSPATFAPLAPLAPASTLRRGVRSPTPTPPSPVAGAAGGGAFAAGAAAFGVQRAFRPQFVETDAEFNEPWREGRELPHSAAPPPAPPQLRSRVGFTMPPEARPARPAPTRTVAAAPARDAEDGDGDTVMVEEWGAELVTSSVRVHVEETATVTRLRSVDAAGRSTTVAQSSSLAQTLAFEQRRENAAFTVRLSGARPHPRSGTDALARPPPQSHLYEPME